MRRALLDGFLDVCSGALLYAAYKVTGSALLSEAGVARGRDGEFAWFTYLEDNWMCTQWWSLTCRTFRALIPHLRVDTTNSVEGLWALVKRLARQLLVSRNFRELFRMLSGSLARGEAAEAARAVSIVGRVLRRRRAVVRRLRLPAADYKRAADQAAIERLMRMHARSVASGGPAYIAFNRSVPQAEDVGAVIFGENAHVHWQAPLPLPASAAAAVTHMSAREAAVLFYKTHKEWVARGFYVRLRREQAESGLRAADAIKRFGLFPRRFLLDPCHCTSPHTVHPRS